MKPGPGLVTQEHLYPKLPFWASALELTILLVEGHAAVAPGLFLD